MIMNCCDGEPAQAKVASDQSKLGNESESYILLVRFNMIIISSM